MEILKKALVKVDRPGTFCVYGKVPFMAPGIRINAVGDLAFPLQKEQAEKIKEQASYAPFGKGMDTLVDLTVRNVWELNPSEVSVHNPAWKNVLNNITLEVGKALGVNQNITPHFYKLLLYEKGSFFLPHQDTEKEDRMFATLTITLPSHHRGGDFTITHEGEKVSFSFEREEDLYYVQYAAFYADCKHEVKSVTEGYRLTLIYNLTFSGDSQLMEAPKNHRYLPDFIKGLEQLRGSSVEKFVIPLDHEYTEKNLSFQNLKNIDYAKGELMIKAAREADFMIYLAFIHREESGSPEDDGYDSRYYGDHDVSSSSYQMEEVYDESAYIEHWIDPEGKEMMFGRFYLEDEEFIEPFDFHDYEPYQQEYEGYAGNYGPSLDQVYRHAAVILWPQERHFVMLAEKGPKIAVSALRAYFDRYLTTQDESVKQECRAFAAVIIDFWEPKRYYPIQDENLSFREGMLEVLLKLDEPRLISKFIEGVMYYTISGKEGPHLAAAGVKWGWSIIAELLNIPKHLEEDQSESLSLLLKALCLGDKTREREQFCQQFFSEVIMHIREYKSAKDRNSYAYSKTASRKNTLVGIVQSASWLKIADRAADFFDHVLQKEDKWSLDRVVLPFLVEMPEEQKSIYDPFIFDDLASKVSKLLKEHLATPLVEPRDWVQNVKLPCSRADCEELQAFLLHPEAKVHRFRVNKERRQYLHQLIERHNLDMNHVTERKGSPHTLVCTKTRRTWEKLKKQRAYREHCYKEIRQLLA
ncbi:MAG: hypothetical protein AAF693_20660 [Bacteroidota bacterium]